MTDILQTIIIDDERGNIDLLKKIIQRHCPMLHLVGEETDPEKGVEMIKELKPDLVFLDINMPTLNGFEVLQSLEPIRFEVIFVTAFDEYAVEAFKVNALGYVTKPIEEENLLRVIRLAQERISQKKIYNNVFSLLSNKISHPEPSKIALSTSHGMLFVNETEVIYCESKGGYTNFFLTDRKPILVSKRLGEFEKTLPEATFVRVHDRYIINLNYVTEYVRGRGGEVTLQTNIKLPVSANRKEELLSRFDKWMNK